MSRSSNRVGIFLFLFLLSTYLLTSGARIAGSDETAFFLETQSLVKNFSLAIPDTIVNNGAYGPDGKYYLGAGIGFTIISIPFYLAGELAASVLPLPEGYDLFVIKAFFSLINAFICALTGVWFFQLCLLLGYRRKTSLVLTLGLMLTTNLFVYAKSSMREPLLTLLLIMLLWYLMKFRYEKQSRFLHAAGVVLVFLMHTKITYAMIAPLAVIYALYAEKDAWFTGGKGWHRFAEWTRQRALWILAGWIMAGILLIFLYQYSMFGNIFSSGYTQRNQSFSTPLLVGIYGLLFSSGKSVFLYAPISLFVFAGIKPFFRQHRAEAILMSGIFLSVLLIHAKYFAWAGDGSWGPRYILPVIPYLILAGGTAVANCLYAARRFKKWLVYALCIVGLLIQIGGSAVYFGSYLRYIGEYPFQREFEDPEFLYRSHFIPNYSPVTGHWELLNLSVSKHLNGEMRNFSVIPGSQQRIPLSVEDRFRIVYVIDFWFMYAYYANISGWLIVPTVLTLLLATIFFSIRIYSAIKRTDTHADIPIAGDSSRL